MSYIKTQEEIQYILDGGKILGEILEHLTTLAIPGATAFDIDAVAERLIRDAGGRPAFKGYRQSKRDPKFPSTKMCLKTFLNFPQTKMLLKIFAETLFSKIFFWELFGQLL